MTPFALFNAWFMPKSHPDEKDDPCRKKTGTIINGTEK
jgi:hypothetical protein